MKGLTNDVAAVVGDQRLAVDVDELRDGCVAELGVRAHATQRDVLRPFVLHWSVRRNSGHDDHSEQY